MRNQHRLAVLCGSLAVGVFLGLFANSTATAADWFEREAKWNGFAQYHFRVAGRAAYLVAPPKAAPGKPWVWRARFPGYHAEMDLLLLKRGFHIGYVDVAGMFGSPKAVKIGDAFYKFVTEQRGLNARCALEGVSRGGLFVYNWAAAQPDKVACIYCDTPVLDFKSWPGGKGGGVGSSGAWRQCQQAYGFDEQQALAYRLNPLDRAEAIASARIPILHIVSENDRVVPPKENTYQLQRRLKAHGHVMEVISVPQGTAKSQGHHFTHPNPQQVVDFVVEHAATSR